MTKEINEGELSAAELAKVSGGGQGPTFHLHCFDGMILENDSPCSKERGAYPECGDCQRNHD